MFSQSSYLHVLELKLLCLSCDILEILLSNTPSLHIVPHCQCQKSHTQSTDKSTGMYDLNCSLHWGSQERHPERGLVQQTSAPQKAPATILHSSFDWSFWPAYNKDWERQFKVFQQRYQFFIPKGSRDTQRESLKERKPRI